MYVLSSSLGRFIPANHLYVIVSMETLEEHSLPGCDDDLDLVRQIAAGDDDALREQYAAYGQRLFAYAVHITGDQSVA